MRSNGEADVQLVAAMSDTEKCASMKTTPNPTDGDPTRGAMADRIAVYDGQSQQETTALTMRRSVGQSARTTIMAERDLLDSVFGVRRGTRRR